MSTYWNSYLALGLGGMKQKKGMNYSSQNLVFFAAAQTLTPAWLSVKETTQKLIKDFLYYLSISLVAKYEF